MVSKWCEMDFVHPQYLVQRQMSMEVPSSLSCFGASRHADSLVGRRGTVRNSSRKIRQFRFALTAALEFTSTVLTPEIAAARPTRGKFSDTKLLVTRDDGQQISSPACTRKRRGDCFGWRGTITAAPILVTAVVSDAWFPTGYLRHLCAKGQPLSLFLFFGGPWPHALATKV